MHSKFTKDAEEINHHLALSPHPTQEYTKGNAEGNDPCGSREPAVEIIKLTVKMTQYPPTFHQLSLPQLHRALLFFGSEGHQKALRDRRREEVTLN